MGEIYPMPYLVLGPLPLAALSIEDQNTLTEQSPY